MKYVFICSVIGVLGLIACTSNQIQSASNPPDQKRRPADEGDTRYNQCRYFYRTTSLPKEISICLNNKGLSVESNSVGTWISGPIGSLDQNKLEAGISKCLAGNQNFQATIDKENSLCGEWLSTSVRFLKLPEQ